MPPSPVRLHDAALPEAAFRRLDRRLRALGTERLKRTYQTTFWFDLGAPSCIVEEAILALAPCVPAGPELRGVEWWLSRMYTTDVRVDFHQDRDEQLALATGQLVHPLISSVLFLNRVRGGALAITEDLPEEDSPSLAPSALDFTLVSPRPNRFVHFGGTLTHGVLDADNQVPDGKLPGRSRLRRTLVMNWWDRQPRGIPRFDEAKVYRTLAL